MEAFKFSLIIPTIGRYDELKNLFKTLQNQTFNNFEVIVIDQNDKIDISPVIEEFKQYLSLKHIKSSIKGASKARNLGIEYATGSIITFPDDDCEYPLNLLDQVIAKFNTDEKLNVLSVTTFDKNNEGKIFRSSKTEKQVTKFNIFKTVIEFGVFVKRNQLKTIRFNDQLGVGSHTRWWSDEGPDFILKLINAGNRVMYYPDLYIYHPNPIKVYNAKTIERSYRYGMGRGKYLQLNQYPFWFVLYVWGLYVAGLFIALININYGMFKYYLFGLAGRIKGYFDHKKY